MACVRYLKSGVDGNVESKLYNDLRDSYGDYVADHVYSHVYGDDFAKSFGNWQSFPNKFRDKLDSNGEPKIETLAPTEESNRAFKLLVDNNLLYPTAVNGVFPRNTGKAKGELMRFAREHKIELRVVGDYVSLEGREVIPSNVFYADDSLIGANKADIAAEQRWVQERFGDKVSFEVTKRLVDGHAMGKFQQGSIYMYENAQEGVAFHEAFHATSQLFLTKGERRSLYNEVRRRDVYKDSVLSNNEIEEILADEFAEYIQSDGKFIVPEAAKEQKNFFKKFLDMIKEFFFGKNPSIREVYENINAGKYATDLSFSKRALKFFERSSKDSFYKTIGLSKPTGTPLMINEKKKVVQGVNKYFMDELFSKGDPERLFAKETDLEVIYDDAMAEIYLDIFEREGYKQQVQKSLKMSDAQFAVKWDEIQDLYNIEDGLLGSQWADVQALHKKQLANYDIIIEDVEIDDSKEEGGHNSDGRNNFKPAIHFDTKDGAPRAIKILVGTLTKQTGTETDMVNDLGLKELADFNTTYDYLARNLAGLPAEWGIFKSKITELSTEKPEFKQLIERLSKEGLTAENLRTQFVQTFSKTKYNYILGMIKPTNDKDSGDIVFIDGNSAKLTDRIQDNWKAVFHSHLTDYNLTVDELLLQVEDTLKGATDNTKGRQEKQAHLAAAYGLLGIKFTNPTALVEDIDGQKPLTIIEALIKYAKNSDVNQADDVFGPKSKVIGRIKALAAIEAKHSNDIVELQHINSEGQTVYGITLNSYLTMVTTELNYVASMPDRTEREKALKERMPHISNSTYAQSSIFLDKILEGKKISVNVFDGLKYDDRGAQGKATKDLTEADKYSQFINGTLKGYYSYLRAADRGVENIVQIEGEKGVLLSGKVDAYTQYKEYLYSEMLSAKHLFENKEKGGQIAFYQNLFKNDNAGLRAFTDVIQNKNVRQLVTAGFNDVEFRNMFEDMSDDIERDFDIYFNRRLKEEKGELERLRIIEKVDGKWQHLGISNDVMEYSLDETILKFIYNSQAAYIEQTKLFTGDLALYKSSDDAFKRFSMSNSTKKISRTGRDMNAFLDKTYPRLDGKISSERQHIKTVIYEDVEAKASSAYLTSMKKIFTESLIIDGYGKGKTLNDHGKAILDGMLSPYRDMEEGDAAGFISLDEYRDLMVRAGDWLPEHDAIFGKLQAGTPLTSEELFYVQPLKTQYAGPLVGKDVDATGVYAHAGYKHALTPLLPAMYSNSTMKHLMDHMTKNKVGIAQFRSGNKFGTLLDLNKQAEKIKEIEEKLKTASGEEKKILEKDLKAWKKGKANEFYIEDAKGKHNINTVGLQYQSIDYKYFGIQLDMNPEIKEKITAGTQLRKLALANLFNKGEARSPEFKGYLARYTELQEEIIKKEVEQLFTDMSIEPTENGYLIKDGAALVEYLAKTAAGKNVADNVLVAIRNLEERDNDDNPTGNLNKIDTLLNKDKVENLLMALINNGAFSEKRNGGTKAQVPSSGYEFSARSKDGGMYTSNELKFYTTDGGKLTAMEVAIPAPKYLLKKYGSVDALNKALADGELDHMKELVGFRIPTQGMNSADYLTIKRFLPAEMGDIIVMPTEIVAKSGSDYDIDKLSLYLRDESAKPGSKADLQNQLLDVTIDIFKHKDNWRQLLAPISDIILVDAKNPDNTTPVVNDVRNLMNKSNSKSSMTNIIEGKTNMEKFKYFLSGKAGVGQTAVHITHQVLTQIANTYVASPHARLFFDHNKVEIEGLTYPSLAGVKDVSGNWITETLSAFMNAYVDIAHDPYIFDLNAGNETANTVFYMLRLGADPKWLGRFMAQPAIQQYVKNREISKSEIAKKGPDRYRSADFADALNSIGLKVNSNSFKGISATMGEELDNEFKKGKDPLVINGLVNKITELQNSYIEPNMDDLKRGIKTIADKKSLSQGDQKLQMQLLDNFLDYQRQSGNLQKLIRATSPDTKGAGKSINTLVDRQREKKEVLDSGFFGNAEAIYSNTFIGEYQKALDAVTSAYSDLTIMQHPSTKDKLDEMKVALSSQATTQRAAEQSRNLVESEFLRYIIATAHTVEGNTLDFSGISQADNFYHIMSKNNPENTVRQVLKLKQGKHSVHGDKLRNNLLIKELIPILDREKQDNVKIFSRKVNTAKENDLVEAFTELYNIDPVLADDIAILTIMQSGMAISPITFTKFIPMDMAVTSKLQNAIKDSIISLDWGIFKPDMKNFEQQFYRNNIAKIPKLQKNQREGGHRRFYDDSHDLTVFPFLKKAKVLEKDDKGKVTKWGTQLFERTDAPSTANYDYEYIATGDNVLGDGIYRSSYTPGENKEDIFQTEDTLNCIKGK